MRLYLKHHIEIARRAAVATIIALFLIANTRSVFHACRHAHVDQVLFHHAAFTLAFAAGIGNYAPMSVAGWAWPGNAEHGLLIADLALAGACLARGWPLRSSRSSAVALLTRFIAAYLGLCLLAEGSFLKGQRYIRARVATALHTGASSLAATAH